MINTRMHGVIDYLMGLGLILVPFLFNFGEQSSAALWVPVALGIVVLLASLITRYELSVAKVIPMQLHLLADVFVGLVLAASPWLFGFADQMWVPHVVLGILEVGIALLTKRRSPYDERDQLGHTATR
jgi:hypothetical protein